MVNKKTYLLIAFLFLVPFFVSAHPGNTASDGCHYCRTRCDYWGVAWNERHCHGGYTAPSTNYNTPATPKPIQIKITTPTPYSPPVDTYQSNTEDDKDDTFWTIFAWFFWGGIGCWAWRSYKKHKVNKNNNADNNKDKKDELTTSKDEDIYEKGVYDNDVDDGVDDDLTRLMEDYDLDRDDAERVQEIMDEYGVDEDEAVEIQEEE